LPACKTPRFFRGVFVFVLGCLVAGVVAAASPASHPSCSLASLPGHRQQERVAVAKVTDGDTLVLVDGRKVRLIGINAPELNPGGRPQPHARGASNLVRQLVADKPVTLVAGAESRDRHGRTLAHLFTATGLSLEAELLRAGLAWHVTVPPNLALADCLAAAEEHARARGLGVWRQPATAVEDVATGGFQRLRGKVTRVSFGRSWYLSLDGRVAAVVAAKNQRHFSRAELQRLAGRTVEIQGWVYPSRSKKYEPWRVQLTTPHMLRERP